MRSLAECVRYPRCTVDFLLSVKVIIAPIAARTDAMDNGDPGICTRDDSL